MSWPLAVLLLLTADAVAAWGRALWQGPYFVPMGTSKHMRMHKSTDRTDVSGPRKGASEEAALYHLEVQSL